MSTNIFKRALFWPYWIWCLFTIAANILWYVNGGGHNNYTFIYAAVFLAGWGIVPAYLVLGFVEFFREQITKQDFIVWLALPLVIVTVVYVAAELVVKL